MKNQSTQVVTGTIRLSYLWVLQPKTDPDNPGDQGKYSVCMLVPKTDTKTCNAIKAAIASAKANAAPLFGGKVPETLRTPLHDGDGVKPNSGEPYGPECKGCWVINASSRTKPGLVDANLNAIIDSTEIYSGMYGRVDVNFYAYKNKGGSGIACGLNNIQKVRDGEPLGGRARAEDVFTVVDNDDDGLGL